MHEDLDTPSDRRARRLRRAGAIAAGLLISATFLAACGGGSKGPGVAGAGSSTTAAKPASSGSTRASALAYSKCMRAHGVSDFPDPNSNGQIQLSATKGSDLTPDSPQFQRAQQACKPLEQAMAPSAAQQRKDFAQALRFAKCMRAHGVPLPDPTPPSSAPQTQSQSGGGNGGAGPDPNSPQFQRAQQACRSLAPGGAAGFSVSQKGAGS
jgi:hypothetical protein